MSAQVTVSNDITLVTLHNAPADMDFIATVFEEIAKLNIDIDMISLSPVQGSTTAVSFTIKDDDLMSLLSYTSKLKSKNIKPVVSSGNSIISIMDYKPKYANCQVSKMSISPCQYCVNDSQIT